jgi:hypothetical protein
VSSFRVFKCDSCQPGFYQDQNYRTNCKVCPQGKYTDSTALTSDCTSCGTGKYQESIAIYSQDFETDAGCSGNNNNCEWECESRTTEKSWSGSNGNKICGGEGKKSGSEKLEKTFTVASGFYHLDLIYYAIDDWEDGEKGYILLNDEECWTKTKAQLREDGTYGTPNLGNPDVYAYKHHVKYI